MAELDNTDLFESRSYVPEFSMRITKAQYGKDNKMRLQMVASDTDADSFDERMSLELFNNFIARRNQPVPSEFADVVCEESWNGGDPYLSLAHYRAGKNKTNVPGMVEDSFIDGNYFKSKAVLDDTELGRTVFKAINEDRKNPDRADKIRVSIAFLDLKHKHGDLVFERNSKADKCPLCEMGVGDKTYLDGYLVHEAFTRVPANPRTSVEVQRMAESILTKKDDARSIVGDLAEGLEEKSKISGDGIVTKNDMIDPSNDVVETPVVEESHIPVPAPILAAGNPPRDYETSPDKPVDVPEIGFAASNRASTTEPDFKNEATVHGGVPDVNARTENGGPDHVADIPYHHLNIAFESLKSAIDKAQTMEDSDEAMKSLVQPMFNKLGDEVRKACMKPYKVDKSVSVEDMRQIASEVFTQGITEQVLPLFAELKSMIAQKPAAVNVQKSDVVPQRSIQLQTRTLQDINPAGDSNKPQSIRQIAAKSTGLVQ